MAERAAAVTAFDGSRYRQVGKALGDFDPVERGDRVVVYATGTLYGEWPDERPFEGNRYLDRCEVRGGKIVRIDAWNDSAEWLPDPSLGRPPEPG